MNPLLKDILAIVAPSVVALIVGIWVKAAVAEIHVSLNSRLTQLLELTAKSSHAKGMSDQKNQGGDGI
jgi:hypothetical protein